MDRQTTTLPDVVPATIRVNGAELYHEIRGNGPPVVLVQGATGDGGSFAQVGDLLADEFTVVTYHRRGNALSPRPDDWNATTVDEQADDLAALIRALDLSPAVVFGTSAGAPIVLNLLTRHPDVVSGAIVHEILLETIIADDGAAREALDRFFAKVGSALGAGGPRAGMEALIRAMFGNAAYESLDPIRRERVLESADTWFSIEFEAFSAYVPDPADLARVSVPTMVAAGTVDILGGAFRKSCAWVARHLGTIVTEFPGAHAPYLDQPEAMVAAMRPFLREVSTTPLVQPKGNKPRPLPYERTGKGDPLVLVPGSLSGWVSWIPHAKALSGSREVIRVQLRGLELVGSGRPVPEGYSTVTETDALLATVDVLGLERFDLAGWSLGGHIALAFTLAHPDRVRTLTLIEPAAYWILRQAGYDGRALDALERTDRSLRGKSVTLEDLKDFLIWAGLGKPGDDFESHPSWPVWMGNRQILAAIGMVWDDDTSLDRLRELDVPMLVIHGTDSAPADVTIARTLAATAPNATLLELPGDHACHLQSGEAFLAALNARLAQDVITPGRG